VSPLLQEDSKQPVRTNIQTFAKADEDTSVSIQDAPQIADLIPDITMPGLTQGLETAVSAKYLFTTKRCPNCRMAKEYLKDQQYTLIDAEENLEIADKYGVMQAPTLLVLTDGKLEKYVNLSNIKEYADRT
jgi:glutaredoxin